MILVKILKRKDASSVILAILIAMIASQPLSTMTGKPASIISGLNNNNGGYFFYGYGPGGGWQSQYLFPFVWVAIQLVALELLAWACVLVYMAFKKMARKKR